METPPEIVMGLKGFPDCEECQCYPECRIDCPDHLKCVERLPEYRDRVFGSHAASDKQEGK